MKKYILLSSLFLGGVVFAAQAQSQGQQPEQQNEEIIIRRKGDFPQDLTIQLKGDQVTINGKRPEDVKGNIEVIRKKSSGNDSEMYGSDQPFGKNPHGFNFSQINPMSTDHNKALLGVLTVPDDSSGGAKVEEVERGTPADSVGLQKGDIIVKINEDSIRSTQDLSNTIGQYSPDDKVTVTYKRNGAIREDAVKLGRNDNGRTYHAFNAPSGQFRFRGPLNGPDMQNLMRQFRQMHPFLTPERNNNMPHLGMVIENRDDQKGVTVKRVEAHSAAAQSGIKPGDVLTSFAGETVNGVNDVLNALHEHQKNDQIQATIVRNGKPKTLTVKIPETHQQADL